MPRAKCRWSASQFASHLGYQILRHLFCLVLAETGKSSIKVPWHGMTKFLFPPHLCARIQTQSAWFDDRNLLAESQRIKNQTLPDQRVYVDDFFWVFELLQYNLATLVARSRRCVNCIIKVPKNQSFLLDAQPVKITCNIDQFMMLFLNAIYTKVFRRRPSTFPGARPTTQEPRHWSYGSVQDLGWLVCPDKTLSDTVKPRSKKKRCWFLPCMHAGLPSHVQLWQDQDATSGNESLPTKFVTLAISSTQLYQPNL